MSSFYFLFIYICPLDKIFEAFDKLLGIDFNTFNVILNCIQHHNKNGLLDLYFTKYHYIIDVIQTTETINNPLNRILFVNSIILMSLSTNNSFLELFDYAFENFLIAATFNGSNVKYYRNLPLLEL